MDASPETSTFLHFSGIASPANIKVMIYAKSRELIVRVVVVNQLLTLSNVIAKGTQVAHIYPISLCCLYTPDLDEIRTPRLYTHTVFDHCPNRLWRGGKPLVHPLYNLSDGYCYESNDVAKLPSCFGQNLYPGINARQHVSFYSPVPRRPCASRDVLPND